MDFFGKLNKIFLYDPKIQTAITEDKGKGHPRTGHEGPEGEQMYSSTLPSTSMLRWWWVGGQHHAAAALPRKDPVPIVQEAGWAPGPVRTGAENLASHRDSIPGPSSP